MYWSSRNEKLQGILLILMHLSPRVGLINGSLKSTVHTSCGTKTHYTNNKPNVTLKLVSALLAIDKAMKSYGAISCVKMYFDNSRSCLHYHGFCDQTMQDMNIPCKPTTPKYSYLTPLALL